MNYKISDLQKILDKNFSDELKPLCKDLVDNGFLRYKKLNYENFNCWWYWNDKGDRNKKQYTFSFNNIAETRKMNYIKKYIHLWDREESVDSFLYALLDVISSMDDGMNSFLETLMIQFGGRLKSKKQVQQISLF